MTTVPHSYRAWLREQCSIQVNESHLRGLPGQMKFIVLDPDGSPIGTADSIDATAPVIELFLNSRMLLLGREPDDYLDDPEAGE